MRADRVKLFCSATGGFLVSVLPLVLLLVAKWEQYTSHGGAFRLCLGGGIVLILILLKVLGKLKLPSRASGLILCLILSYLLDAVLADLTLILWVALLGELADALFFSRLSRRLRERLRVERQADATAERMETVLKQYFETGGQKDEH